MLLLPLFFSSSVTPRSSLSPLRLTVSIYSSAFSSPFPILSVSSTREGRIADVFTIVVSLDRKVRRGCRYRACSLPISFLRALFSAPRLSFHLSYRGRFWSLRAPRIQSRAIISRFSIFVTIASPIAYASTTRSTSNHTISILIFNKVQYHALFYAKIACMRYLNCRG